MSIFNEIINIWKSDNLLSQAWNESIDMLALSNKIFDQSIANFNSGEAVEVVKALKKEDKLINSYQMSVRRKVLTHFSMDDLNVNISSGLVLVDMVVDIERIGDYCKNISDLTLAMDTPIDYEVLSEKIRGMEKDVSARFSKTLEAIKNQDTEIAESLMSSYQENITTASDDIVSGILNSSYSFNSSSKSAAIILYARYLKRIGAHLKNITTTIINPYDKIGYRKE